jgi:galactokinase
MTAGGDDQELAAVHAWIAARADFFDAARPVLLARAPGRLDVMGGIADYAGSLVLELPLAVATWVAVQTQDAPTLVIDSTDASGGRDAAAAGAIGDRRVVIPLEDIVPAAPLPYSEARIRLSRDPERAWAAYIAGALVVLQHEHRHRPRHGLKVLLRSSVPIGKGVSSSAALEVAALEALASVAGLEIDDRDLALSAQKIENLVVGAPCGVMDQMTAACGRHGHLLELLCQPAEVVGHLAIPPALALFGVDSGIPHEVARAAYGTARAAAFMGYRIVADAAGLVVRPIAPGRVAIEDPRFGGYLANVTPEQWRGEFRDAVPEAMTGRDFLARYGGSTDEATSIEADRTYDVRAATEHPILEHDRVRRFRALLAAGAVTDEGRASLGQLMYESHASYSACGLGSDGTDRVVELIREVGPAGGLYGAKITGGGSGGTVAVLAAQGRRAAIDEIARRYQDETGRAAMVFEGSSSGTRPYGLRSYTRL